MINNPESHGFTHEIIKEQLALFSGLIYWCMCDEIGEDGTYHTHIYFVLKNATRFDTVKTRFPSAHIEACSRYSTSMDNRNYIRKEGKWEHDKKKETNLIDTFEEFGDCPNEQQGKRTDYDRAYELIRDGVSNAEIYAEMPHMITKGQYFDKVRDEIRFEEYKDKWRDVEVTFIYGATGTGKTRGVFEKHGYSNVYRVTDYVHPFDDYRGEPVIVFEEFRSSLKIGDMLNYTDGYPLRLPSRYSNKQACFETVYIISNEPLYTQYASIQIEHPETWAALCRRIDKVFVYNSAEEILEYDTDDYFSTLGYAFEQKKYLRKYSADSVLD